MGTNRSPSRTPTHCLLQYTMEPTQEEITDTVDPIRVQPVVLKAKGGISKKYRGIYFSNNQGMMRKLSAKQKEFLKAFANEPFVTRAAEKAQVTKQSHYYWMRTDEIYKKIFEGMSDIIVGDLEEIGQIRAIEGVTKEIFFQGQVCGTEQQFSDTLLMFFLKAKRPDIYRERTSIDLTSKPIDVDSIDPQLRNLSSAALLQIRGIIEAETQRTKVIEAGI